MSYNITLDKEQIKALIEMIEKHRCEGENELCSNLRTSIKNQYQSQYREEQEDNSMTEEEVIDNSKAAFGPNHCDSCD